MFFWSIFAAFSWFRPGSSAPPVAGFRNVSLGRPCCGASAKFLNACAYIFGHRPPRACKKSYANLRNLSPNPPKNFILPERCVFLEHFLNLPSPAFPFLRKERNANLRNLSPNPPKNFIVPERCVFLEHFRGVFLVPAGFFRPPGCWVSQCISGTSVLRSIREISQCLRLHFRAPPAAGLQKILCKP